VSKQLLLLDTCAAIWIAEDAPVADAAVEALDAAAHAGATTYVSPITAWEVGQLVARGRLQLLMTPERWFRRLIEVPQVRLADMSPELLIASSFLPGAPPRDPADRIILATARDLGATLITRDRALLGYGEEGHVSVLAC
jgi:PIN domain nuclease of toxin-antitoxin system